MNRRRLKLILAAAIAVGTLAGGATAAATVLTALLPALAGTSPAGPPPKPQPAASTAVPPDVDEPSAAAFRAATAGSYGGGPWKSCLSTCSPPAWRTYCNCWWSA